MYVKHAVLNNLKNIRGWRTSRKIIVFAVDDYGNVRVASKKAREQMNQAGLKVYSRFDEFDSLETADDLNELFKALESVRDSKARPAVFTAYALPCNIDFEGMEAEGYQHYKYELLTDTFAKQNNGDATWRLWKEGIRKGLIIPQFHGREHLHIQTLEDKLSKRDHEVLSALRSRSYTSIRDDNATISYSAAFDFWDVKENEKFESIVMEGLLAFEKVFGKRAANFTPPGGNMHPSLWRALNNGGIKYTDLPLVEKQHQGLGKYKSVWNYTGKIANGQNIMVRNVVFEPTFNTSFDWVRRTIQQIEAAFFWGKPAIISSHRVNFSGDISEENRAIGINALRNLLVSICKRWPEVEFMSAENLGELIFKQDLTNV